MRHLVGIGVVIAGCSGGKESVSPPSTVTVAAPSSGVASPRAQASPPSGRCIVEDSSCETDLMLLLDGEPWGTLDGPIFGGSLRLELAGGAAVPYVLQDRRLRLQGRLDASRLNVYAGSGFSIDKVVRVGAGTSLQWVASTGDRATVRLDLGEAFSPRRLEHHVPCDGLRLQYRPGLTDIGPPDGFAPAHLVGDAPVPLYASSEASSPHLTIVDPKAPRAPRAGAIHSARRQVHIEFGTWRVLAWAPLSRVADGATKWTVELSDDHSYAPEAKVNGPITQLQCAEALPLFVGHGPRQHQVGTLAANHPFWFYEADTVSEGLQPIHLNDGPKDPFHAPVSLMEGWSWMVFVSTLAACRE